MTNLTRYITLTYDDVFDAHGDAVDSVRFALQLKGNAIHISGQEPIWISCENCGDFLNSLRDVLSGGLKAELKKALPTSSIRPDIKALPQSGTRSELLQSIVDRMKDRFRVTTDRQETVGIISHNQNNDIISHFGGFISTEDAGNFLDGVGKKLLSC